MIRDFQRLVLNGFKMSPSVAQIAKRDRAVAQMQLYILISFLLRVEGPKPKNVLALTDTNI